MMAEPWTIVGTTPITPPQASSDDTMPPAVAAPQPQLPPAAPTSVPLAQPQSTPPQSPQAQQSPGGNGDPWAVVDRQQVAAPAAPSAADPWAVVGQEPLAPGNRPHSVLGNVGAGFNETLANTLGFPVDAVTWAMNLVPRGINAVAGTDLPKIEHPVGGSETIKGVLGVVGANPDEYAAQTTAERVARGTGGGVAAMMLPWGAARTAAELAPVANPATRSIPRAVVDAFGHGSLPSTAIVGGAGGAAGTVLSDQVPEPYKGLADLAGNLIGGGGVALLHELGTIGVQSILNAGRNLLGPLTEAGRERLAGLRIQSAATDPAAVRNDLANQEPPLVPGSAPTTFQATGDQGVGNLERASATTTPAPFLERRGDQNAARLAAVESLAPADARPEAVGEFVKGQLDAVDAAHDQLVDATRASARQAIEQIGGAPGEDAQTALQQYGSRLRGVLADANNAAKQRESALWQAIDPDGALVLDASPVATAARQIADDLPRLAKPMDGEESAIFKGAISLGDAEPFADITALRSRLQTAIREERYQRGGESPVLRRLQMLQGAVDDAVNTAAERQATQEQQAVASGAMSEQDAIAARLQQQANDWYAARDGATQTEAGRTTGAGAGAVSGGVGSSAVPSASRTGFTSDGGPGSAARSQGVPSQARLTPNFDDAAAERYQEARTATRERKETFKRGSVGQALQPGQGAEFRLPDSQVAARFFNSGKRAAEDANAFSNAVGGRDKALSLIRDYAAFDLRRSASNPDGTLNLAKYERWTRAHNEALSVFPELRPGFENAAAAQRSLETVTAHAADAAKAARNGVAAQFVGADPVKAVQSVLRSANPEQAFAELARATSGNVAARDGLRRAVVSYIRDRLVGNTEAANTGTTLIKSDQFQSFVQRNHRALAQLFEPAQMTTIRAVARDLQRANRSIAGSRLPGASNTAQDTAAMARHRPQDSLLGQIATAAGGALVGHTVGLGAETGLLGLVGAKVLAQLRRTGLDRVNDLVGEAMLNPELARSLLVKVAGETPSKGIISRVAAQLGRLPDAGEGRALSADRGSSSQNGAPRASIPWRAPEASPTATREAQDLRAWVGGKRPPTELPHRPEPGDPVSMRLEDGSAARGIFRGRSGEAATVDFFDHPSNPESVRGRTLTGAERNVEFSPMKLTEAERQRVAANEAATSPLNGEAEPTSAQKAAGNYRKGHLDFQGLDVSIENPQGSVRSGTAPDGMPWQVEMPAHYGYIRRTTGADGEHVDTYVGGNPKASKAFVIDQIDPATGKFDEHKALLGFDDERQAISTYLRGFSDGSAPSRIGGVTTMPMPKFRRWLKTGDTTAPLRFEEIERNTSAPAPEISPIPEPAPPGRVQSAAPGQTPDTFRPGQPTPKLEQNRGDLRQAVYDEVKRLAPGTKINVLDKLTQSYGNRVYRLDGSYLDGIISVALSANNPVRIARHEVIHALRDLGLIKPAEWKVLARASEQHWMDHYDIDATYGDAYGRDAEGRERMIEEGVAEAFADFNPSDARAWAQRAGNAPPAAVSAFKRLWNFFQRVRSLLSGQGFRSLDDAFAVRDTFERIQSGEIGRRPWQRNPIAEAAAIAEQEAASIAAKRPPRAGVSTTQAP